MPLVMAAAPCVLAGPPHPNPWRPLPAVSAGTNLMLVASTSAHLAQLGALSSNGRSKTFDAAADGYGRGEACIVFVARMPGSDQAPLAVLHGASSHWLHGMAWRSSSPSYT